MKYFRGVPSPVKRPEAVDMVIFRENTEDIYAGVEWLTGTPECQGRRLPDPRHGGEEDPVPEELLHRDQADLVEGSERLIRAAIRYASSTTVET